MAQADHMGGPIQCFRAFGAHRIFIAVRLHCASGTVQALSDCNHRLAHRQDHRFSHCSARSWIVEICIS